MCSPLDHIRSLKVTLVAVERPSTRMEWRDHMHTPRKSVVSILHTPFTTINEPFSRCGRGAGGLEGGPSSSLAAASPTYALPPSLHPSIHPSLHSCLRVLASLMPACLHGCFSWLDLPSLPSLFPSPQCIYPSSRREFKGSKLLHGHDRGPSDAHWQVQTRTVQLSHNPRSLRPLGTKCGC